MATVSVFEFKDYKRFVQSWIEQAPRGGRGYRKALADAIGCQTPFVTHVLSGEYHFSAEQAESCGRWMGLTETETEFLILLVMYQRAGTKNLEKLLDRQISLRREVNSVLKTRVGIQESLSEHDQLIYYSSWQYAAVHLAVLNPHLQTVEALQKHFEMPLARLLRILDFLTERGLVRKDKQLYRVASPFLHLDRESPILKQHHANWRLKAIDTFTERDAANLHYSGVISLSEEDFEWVRERLSKFLEEVAARVKNSRDEKIAALTFDWFGV